ncbi:MAG: GNAT family N-acetyltransferase [Cyanophyceae cyanobacterium]
MQISTYQPHYQTQVIELISSIQQEEFGAAITLAAQPDLLEIPKVYQQGNGNFWVVLEGKRVIGTIAAIDMGDHRLALRKMFVAAPYRGKATGLGQRLLDTLCQWARARNVYEIYLGTIEAFKAAHRFYEKNGFTRVEKTKLPMTFPIMEGDTRFYQLVLFDERRLQPD